jgi:hypothetical protein
VGAAARRGRLSDSQRTYARSLTWDRVAASIMAAAAGDAGSGVGVGVRVGAGSEAGEAPRALAGVA